MDVDDNTVCLSSFIDESMLREMVEEEYTRRNAATRESSQSMRRVKRRVVCEVARGRCCSCTFTRNSAVTMPTRMVVRMC
jgi:hypothetical protein